MALEQIGVLRKILPPLTGTGTNGTWSKQEFIIETFGEYPKKICFELWNEKTTQVTVLPIGTAIKVSFSPESREYNDRWYTTLRVYNVTTNVGITTQTTQPAPQPAMQSNNTPQPPANLATAERFVEPDKKENDDDESDDLPF